MKTEKALALELFMISAINTLHALSEKTADNESAPDELLNLYREECFNEHFQQFTTELRENIREYRDVNVVLGYTLSCFNQLTPRDAASGYATQPMPANGNDRACWMDLCRMIGLMTDRIQACCSIGVQSGDDCGLSRIFEEEMKLLQRDETDAVTDAPPAKVPVRAEQFDFIKIKAICDRLDTTNEKIKFINDLVIDLLQWEILYDISLTDERPGTSYLFSTLYYPNFKELCDIELRRLHSNSKLEKKMHKEERTQAGIHALQFKRLYWNSNETDLLELVASLHEIDAIQHLDRTKIARAELTRLAGAMFGIEIKDAEVKLARATCRNNKTPFLDQLAKAFRAYSLEKEDRAKKQRR